MRRTCTIPAASATPLRPLVAGLDLLTTSESDADALAVAVAEALMGAGATDVTVATHWARVRDLRHVALTAGWLGLDLDAGWSALHAGMGSRSGDQFGVLLADRYSGSAELGDSVAAAVAAHTACSTGRAVVFPGSAGLTGSMPVAQVLASSSIDRVLVLAEGDADPEAIVVTRDFVRPRWLEGQLVLQTQAASGGTLVPFETPAPTPCCADHAGGR